MKKHNLMTALLVAGLAGGLAACGGGGSGSGNKGGGNPGGGDSGGTPVTKTGQFLDSPVSGLRYVREDGSSDYTDSGGRFTYVDGEIIKFFLGEHNLVGTAAGQPTVTPLSLLEHLTGKADRTINLLRLLQSVDADNDPSNGIEILATVSSALDAQELDLDLPADQFEASTAVRVALQAVTRSELVAEDDALNHFNTTVTALRTDSPGFIDGATWIATERHSACPGKNATYTITFANGKITLKGNQIEHRQTRTNEFNDPVYDCVTETINWTGSVADWSRRFCGQDNCDSFAALNTSFEDDDSNGRVYNSWEAGSRLVRQRVHYRNPERNQFNGFSHLLTLIKAESNSDEQPKVDLTGTWNVKSTHTSCPGQAGYSTYIFGKDRLTGTLEELSYFSDVGSCKLERETIDTSYAKAADFLALGPVYDLGDLNRQYPDPDDNGNPVFVMYDEASDTVTRFKDFGRYGISKMVMTRAAN